MLLYFFLWSWKKKLLNNLENSNKIHFRLNFEFARLLLLTQRISHDTVYTVHKVNLFFFCLSRAYLTFFIHTFFYCLTNEHVLTNPFEFPFTKKQLTPKNTRNCIIKCVKKISIIRFILTLCICLVNCTTPKSVVRSWSDVWNHNNRLNRKINRCVAQILSHFFPFLNIFFFHYTDDTAQTYKIVCAHLTILNSAI